MSDFLSGLSKISDGVKHIQSWPIPSLGENNPTVLKLQKHPEIFMRDFLGVKKLWKGQEQIIKAITEHQRISVASGHALGKDYISARLILWFLYSFMPSIVIATAATDRQVDKVIWGEISEAFHSAPIKLGGRLITKQLLVDEKKKWYAMGFSTKDVRNTPGKFQGFHQRNVMILFSEAQAIEHSIWEQADSLMTGEFVRFLAIGNPRINHGPFHDTFKSDNSWHNIRLDCEDSPNVKENKIVVPGLCTKVWVDFMANKYGKDHPTYKSMVNGISPPRSEDAFIDAEWIEWANTHGASLVPSGGARIVGCDPSTGVGADNTVIVTREGMKVVDVKKSNTMKPMETAGQLVGCLQQGAARVYLDITGATGIYDRLCELGYKDKVVPVNFGGRPQDDISDSSGLKNSQKYADMSTQMYSRIAELMEKHKIYVPYDENLSLQLLNRKMMTRSDGKAKLEPKVDYKERGFDSPDEADAFVLCFCQANPPNYVPKPFVQETEDKSIGSMFDRGEW